jgi:hypothetical protein
MQSIATDSDFAPFSTDSDSTIYETIDNPEHTYDSPPNEYDNPLAVRIQAFERR